MASNRKLLQLSSLVQENTAKVDAYIQDNNLPEPSFEASYPPVLDLPPEADAACNAALEALDELRDHLLGPMGVIINHGTSNNLGRGICSVSRISAFQTSSEPPIRFGYQYPELAKTCGMHPDDAEMIVRSGVARRLLLQREDGKIAHSAGSKAMATIPSMDSFVEAVCANVWSAAPLGVDAMEKWPGSQEPNQTAYNLVHRMDLTFFEDLAKHETKARHFANLQALMQSSPALKLDFVLHYDWSQHARGTVVDVGGSQGAIARKLAEKYTDMKVIVQDRPEVIAHAPQPANKNIQFQAHDFFTPQPVKGADVYLFRWILHDWPTKYCIKILQALIPALRAGSRIVLMDAIIPEPGVLSPFQERVFRTYNMTMKMLFNAKERSENEWRSLIGDADEAGRFKVVELLRPAES